MTHILFNQVLGSNFFVNWACPWHEILVSLLHLKLTELTIVKLLNKWRISKGKRPDELRTYLQYYSHSPFHCRVVLLDTNRKIGFFLLETMVSWVWMNMFRTRATCPFFLACRSKKTNWNSIFNMCTRNLSHASCRIAIHKTICRGDREITLCAVDGSPTVRTCRYNYMYVCVAWQKAMDLGSQIL